MTDKAWLVLEDGGVYQGRWFGAAPSTWEEFPSRKIPEASQFAQSAVGEVVFNTGMTGYHEILTDPSYTGQIVTMTYPHMGNYGDMDEWDENWLEAHLKGGKPAAASGLVVRSLYDGPLPQDRQPLITFMKKNGLTGISEVDTRGLTLRIRKKGAPRGVIITSADGKAPEKMQIQAVTDYLKRVPSMEGMNLVDVLASEEKQEAVSRGKTHVAVIDYGSKANIIRDLAALECRVTVYPSGVTAEEILHDKPDLVLLSNGPGDPGVLTHQVETARKLIGKIPLSGICLGHQIIAQALGAQTYKMKFGHHGCNHPVRDELTGKILITSQNHGFAVEKKSLPRDVVVWHTNANDGSLEGLRHKELPIRCVQFHPESAPGPRDSLVIFEEFLEMIDAT